MRGMDRRQFIHILTAAGTGFALIPASRCSSSQPIDEELGLELPSVQMNAFATETVLNSRRSYHSGFSGVLPDQVLANVLWATGRAPLAGLSRTIYAALPTEIYRYDPARHELIRHLAGNHLSLAGLAFEVGIISDVTEDAGIASHFGLLAATASWAGTSNQAGFFPSATAMYNATATWNAGTFTFAASYGLMGTVSGMTTALVAVSSDGSLPDPSTSSPAALENVISDLDYGNQFASQDLGIGQVSQIAWASYGNTPHLAVNGRAALTSPSSHGEYYLTGRIYIVRSSGTERYHIRLPGGDPMTRDHRIERVTDGDRRPQLRAAAAGLPPSAPVYFVYCATAISLAQQLEGGFAAAGALIQATSSGLRGYVTTGFTEAERLAIIAALGIPAGDLPMLIVSAGLPS